MSAAKRDENRQVSLILQNTLNTGVLYPTAVSLADSVAQHVAIVDGNGDQIVSFGAGQQYTDGALPPIHPIGTMPIFNNAGTWSQVGTTNPLPINLYAQGTLLNQSGGNLLVNVQNFAVGTYGNGDATAANLTSALTFSENLLFNGTTWSRWSGDTTNGAWVNIKAMIALPAGTNIIGKVTTDQTSHGTTDLVAADITKVGGAAFSLGQQLAAASLPVILPSATITSLTPPSNAGYALDTSLATIDTDIKSNITLHAGTNTIGGAVPTPSASTTALSLNRQTALSNTAIAIKASAGRIYKVHFYNSNSSPIFVQFYDVASGSVTVGTTIPNWTWYVPAQGAFDDTLEIPLPAGTAITIAATTTITGGLAPTTGLLAEIGYM